MARSSDMDRTHSFLDGRCAYVFCLTQVKREPWGATYTWNSLRRHSVLRHHFARSDRDSIQQLLYGSYTSGEQLLEYVTIFASRSGLYFHISSLHTSELNRKQNDSAIRTPDSWFCRGIDWIIFRMATSKPFKSALKLVCASILYIQNVRN